jgi:hypothetical protein
MDIIIRGGRVGKLNMGVCPIPINYRQDSYPEKEFFDFGFFKLLIFGVEIK